MNFPILIFLYALLISNSVFAADEIHWTFTGPTSVTFDWRGTEDALSFRISTATPPYTYTTVTGVEPAPLPTSSSGPFWEASITGLQPNALYYYSIGNGPEHTFITPPLPGRSDFTVYVEGDVGSTNRPSYLDNVIAVQNIIGNVYGNGFPDFALLVGDLSYADINGVANVDQHFNDVMTWSQDAAYMPAWGNHEWNTSMILPDHLNNYEGRFALPNSFTSPGADSAVGNGPDEDWYWFDYGNVRFIAYPEPYAGAWSDWNTKVQSVMAAAQQDPSIDFIVTFGHRPAYSSSSPGQATLQNYLDVLGLQYSKYVLDLSGHHHDYERTDPAQTNGVTHVVVGTGHTPISAFTTTQPSWSLFRTIQPGALKLHFAGTYIQGEFICAPVSSACSEAGTVLDAFAIGDTPPTVSITAPASGSTVAGIFPVSADAADNVNVAGVQFKLDGANLGNEDTTAPYSVSWATGAAPDGAHSLSAVARDGVGNLTTSSVIPVTVNNTVADTAPPTVSMSAPIAGATVSSQITVSASASDNFGVMGVQFKLDGTNLGSEDTIAPYSVSWDTLTASAGGHNLTAVARDAAGNVTPSSAVAVTVDNSVADTTAPTISMTAPSAGAAVSGTISIAADAADNVGVAGVQFVLDGANLGLEDTTAPYSLSWNTASVPAGGHTLTAVARDAAGNLAMSGSVAVSVNNPVAGSNLTHQWLFDETAGTTALDSIGTNSATLTNALWATGKIGNAVSFNGTNASGDAGKIDFGTGNFTVAHWVKVNGFKNYAAIFNNRSSASGNVGFHTRTDGTGTITTLIDFGATSKSLAVTTAVTGTWYHVAVSVNRTGLMKLYVNGVIAGQVDISSFSATPITNTDNVRIGRDQASNYFNGLIDDLRIYNTALSASDIANIYITDTTPPTVSMTAPASGATVSSKISVSANASDNTSVAGVQFKLDGANLGLEVTTAPYAISWYTATAQNGAHSLTAVARDAAGNTTTSSAVAVTVNNPDTAAPVVSMTAPASGAILSGTVPLSANATDNVGVAGVQFELDGANLGGEVTSAPYSSAWDTTGVANGVYTLTAVARDAAGNVTTSGPVSVSVNNSVIVDTAPPTVSMTAPASGATVSGIITLSATATDDVGVAGVQFKLGIDNLDDEIMAAPYSGSWDTTTVANGVYTLSAVARDAAGNTTTSSTVSVTVNNIVADTTPPTVSMTAPATGATVSGIISVSAAAADDVGVTGVQFELDGANLGGEVASAPYSSTWDTNGVANGTYNLTAVAKDAAGNMAISSAVSVTVKNPVPLSSDVNLTHQWKFNETSGTTALDSVGTNNAGLSNALWVTGKIGNAVSFNGTNASGDAGKIDFGTGNFTVAHWVNVNGFKNYSAIFNNRSSASGNLGFHTRTDGTGSFTALIDFGATSKSLAVTNAVTGTWYHVAVSVDRAGLMKLYLNGVLSGQADISSFRSASITNTDNVRLGRDQSSNYFNGAIDDLRIYNTALSATDIFNIYSQ